MGGTIKLVDFAGRCHISFAGQSPRRPSFVPLRLGYRRDDLPIVLSLGFFFPDADAERTPGSVSFHKESNTLAVCCKVCFAFPRIIAGGRLACFVIHAISSNVSILFDIDRPMIDFHSTRWPPPPQGAQK